MNNYYESSYLTWELTSNKNLEFITAVFEHLEYLEENEVNTWKHAETSDYYFQQRPIGGDRPFPILDATLLATDLQAILSSHGLAPEGEIVFVKDQQMDNYRHQIQEASCFSNASYAIFFSSENNIVKRIWFDYDEGHSVESNRLAMAGLLHHLGEKYALVLVDWYEKRAIDLSNKEATLQYLKDTSPKTV